MASLPCHPVVRRAILASVTVLTAIGWSQTAYATCGDYLSGHASRVHGLSAPSPGEPQTPGAPTCRDGSCRRGLPPAAPKAPSVVERVSEHGACTPAADPPPRAEASPCATDGPAFVCSISRAAPFRPPEA
jgi:hypothetical protein